MIVLIARLLLAGVFLWGAVAKAVFPPSEATMYGALLMACGPALRYAMIVVEAGLAVWLASGWRPRASAWTTVLVLSVFCGAIVSEAMRDHPRPCGCHGKTAEEASSGEAARRVLLWSLGRNGAMAVAASWVMVGPGCTRRRN